MIAGQVASRYSRALFKLAASKEELEKRQQDLEGVVSILQSLPKLGQFLSAPQISRVDKEKVLEKSLGSKLDPQLLHFMLFLLEKGRLKHLPEISRAYHRMVKESLGILEASLITAVPAEAKIKENLQKKLEIAYQKKIEMKEKTDPQIMGGVILVVANQVMDWSIRDRLSSLKDNLLSVSV
jgi:F-type H+-transporting ATPase subunit delta